MCRTRILVYLITSHHFHALCQDSSVLAIVPTLSSVWTDGGTVPVKLRQHQRGD